MALPDTIELTLGLDDADDDAALRAAMAKKLNVPVHAVPPVRIARRVIDARGRRVRFHLQVTSTPLPDREQLGLPVPVETKGAPKVIVIGDGPCGLFCAYELARAGIASIVVDRGKTVNPRRVDLKGLNRPTMGVVDADSNYCFGEGGAGTYSDGKLYTRATKRGDVHSIYETFVRHQAPVDILSDARPHIGSNLLPKVVADMREHLEKVGVQFVFGQRVSGLITSTDHTGRRQVRGVKLTRTSSDDVVDELRADAVVLATGHSARDVYRFLHDDGVQLAPKAFALGVRIEHPQALINRIQYGASYAHPKLPAAAYSIAHTTDEGGVFSFCMCPGGFIVPASTDAEGLVVNGMSLKKRDNAYANSGLVASISVDDALTHGFDGPLGLLRLQETIEVASKQQMLAAGGQGLMAPAVRVPDFLKRKRSSTLPTTSYQPGLISADLDVVLNAAGVDVANRLRGALHHFGAGMKDYVGEDAVLIGVETRTSSPVRIPRDDVTLMNPDIAGLFPAGEGGGYAGGIVSAALDGVRVARAVLAHLPATVG